MDKGREDGNGNREERLTKGIENKAGN